MRILFDESLPLQLAADFAAQHVATVRPRQRAGMQSAVLLGVTAAAGFSVLVTADRSFRSQHDLKLIGIGIIVISGVRNRIQELRPLIPRIVEALALIRPGDVFEITPAQADSTCDRGMLVA